MILALIPVAAAGVVFCQRLRLLEPLPPPTLTAEFARSALISLIKSSDAGSLEEFPLEKWRSAAVATDEDWTHWGPITLKLDDSVYEFTINSGPEARLCKTWYRGAFEFRDGTWVALRPKLYQSALIDGRRTKVLDK